MNKKNKETETSGTMINKLDLLIVIEEIMKKYPSSKIDYIDYIYFRWQALINYILGTK